MTLWRKILIPKVSKITFRIWLCFFQGIVNFSLLESQEPKEYVEKTNDNDSKDKNQNTKYPSPFQEIDELDDFDLEKEESFKRKALLNPCSCGVAEDEQDYFFFKSIQGLRIMPQQN